MSKTVGIFVERQPGDPVLVPLGHVTFVKPVTIKAGETVRLRTTLSIGGEGYPVILDATAEVVTDPVPLTWKAFKDAVESQGVKDEDEMSWIDWHANYKVEVSRYKAGSVKIEDGDYIEEVDDETTV